MQHLCMQITVAAVLVMNAVIDDNGIRQCHRNIYENAWNIFSLESNRDGHMHIVNTS